MYRKPTVPMVGPWVREFCTKPGNSVGGVLHIVLADANVKDLHVRCCMERAREAGDVEGERLAQTIAYMSRTQRLKLREWIR